MQPEADPLHQTKEKNLMHYVICSASNIRVTEWSTLTLSLLAVKTKMNYGCIHNVHLWFLLVRGLAKYLAVFRSILLVCLASLCL
jgi:hypothetical protein